MGACQPAYGQGILHAARLLIITFGATEMFPNSAEHDVQDTIYPPLKAFHEVIDGVDFFEGAVLVNVPLVPLELIDREVSKNRGYFAYPPTTQLYVSALLRKQGVPTEVVDLNFVALREAQRDEGDPRAAWAAALDAALAKFKRPIVGVSLMFDSTFDEFEQVCRYIRARKPDALIMGGGVAATADPERLLADRLVDLVFLHEGESTLPLFYDYIRGKGDYRAIVNVAFADRDSVVHTFPKSRGGEFDIDLRDEYGKVPMAEYCQIGSLSTMARMNGVDRPYATMLTRRGCRARCAFCSVANFNGRGVRVRHADGVVDEMRYLYDTFGIRHFAWLDDDLLYNQADALRLFRQMAERLPGVTWVPDNGVIAAAVTRELLEAMEASGCTGLKVGMESGNPEVLRRIHKPTNHAKLFEFSRLVQDFPKLFVNVMFILGFPSETIAQMQDSLATGVQSRLDWVNFFFYQHLKNTEMHQIYQSVSLGSEDIRNGGENFSSTFSKDFNPVRGFSFVNPEQDAGVVRGYDVFDLPPDMEPSRAQLKEIWFTYNIVANYLMLPALTTEQDERIGNAITFLTTLMHAYPRDASMATVIYYLQRRRDSLNSTALSASRDKAYDLLKSSPYWQRRDADFNFSAMLDGGLPEIDQRCRRIIGTHPVSAAGTVL